MTVISRGRIPIMYLYHSGFWQKIVHHIILMSMWLSTTDAVTVTVMRRHSSSVYGRQVFSTWKPRINVQDFPQHLLLPRYLWPAERYVKPKLLSVTFFFPSIYFWKQISIYCYYSTITKQCSFLVLQHVKQETSLFRRSSGCPQATKIVLGLDLSLIPSNSLSATKLASAESRALTTRPLLGCYITSSVPRNSLTFISIYFD